MLVPFIRAIILYSFIILATRLMGKRQVGEMQPNDLVITILISAVASVPMQDMDIPLTHGLVPIFTLVSAEVLSSLISLRSPSFRKLVNGSPITIIRDGVPDQKAMKKLRMTIDDIMEELRLKDIFDLRQVKRGQIEPNGKLSVLLTEQASSPTLKDMGIKTESCLPFSVIISDGVLSEENLTSSGKDEKWLSSVLSSCGACDISEVFLMCLGQKGEMIFFKKEKK